MNPISLSTDEAQKRCSSRVDKYNQLVNVGIVEANLKQGESIVSKCNIVIHCVPVVCFVH